MVRKAALMITPTIEISLSEDQRQVKFFSQTKVKTFDITFRLDGECKQDSGEHDIGCFLKRFSINKKKKCKKK